MSVQRGKLQKSKRDLVLNDFAKDSRRPARLDQQHLGGRGHPQGIRQRADLAVQVVYKRPETNKEAKVVQIGTARQGREAARERIPT